ncbi:MULTISPECIES: hypothetical protein [unclassified Streptomyces]|uniref:hypothetical protein n=1 Tax=unclassified Streptomyces TaxID=2593676 RepID=UPI001164A655|nr:MULTISPECIES: hypothetical protein [unclassified Streptomyces]NMI57100.1 hypothetical protein [Streptomyces sp. RLA2-12]QDN56480.1 hypothetical protein FNV67_15300 [Streptomyces sp. S1D4-20]QDN66657.1 hypothetical protein FNV66_14895 [Streptomyces sp. S1D4-14]QDO49064.1 hypothetical protein FNV60_13145 [Streptomyces sp. RLB3-5]QDO59305.1 hypothetical protein FNV59_15390 [Streptomyces sp. RLB1-8]
MTSRDIRARIDRLTKAIGEQQPNVPVCRFHGTACRLGANWPLRYEEGPVDDLLDIRAAGLRRLGLEVEPHPRDLWATDRHERVPQEELDRQKRELEELIAAQRAKNDQVEAELRDARAAVTATREERHG